jgi:hypothetical protein
MSFVVRLSPFPAVNRTDKFSGVCDGFCLSGEFYPYLQEYLVAAP